MGAEVMSAFFQLLNDRCKSSIAVKPPGEEKGCFYFLLIECGKNIFSSFGIFIAGKYECYLFFGTITANDRAAVGFQFFFTLAGFSASLAANR